MDLDTLFDTIDKDRNELVDMIKDIAADRPDFFVNNMLDLYLYIKQNDSYMSVKYLTDYYNYKGIYMKQLEEYFIDPADLDIYTAQKTAFDYGATTDVYVYEYDELHDLYRPKKLLIKADQMTGILASLIILCTQCFVQYKKLKKTLYQIFIDKDEIVESENRSLVSDFVLKMNNEYEFMEIN